jgi:hypothetical protein
LPRSLGGDEDRGRPRLSKSEDELGQAMPAWNADMRERTPEAPFSAAGRPKIEQGCDGINPRNRFRIDEKCEKKQRVENAPNRLSEARKDGSFEPISIYLSYKASGTFLQ